MIYIDILEFTVLFKDIKAGISSLNELLTTQPCSDYIKWLDENISPYNYCFVWDLNDAIFRLSILFNNKADALFFKMSNEGDE